ncbi:3-hydroxyacyl-CoA dehydrogenase NAD-binding domain-containing protein [Bradyrhizobium sp. HKCCYLS1011]|uniref:3-hydroxyacyl-CoA dehydrogenase NAD-binding domain-containing protein n=1 Tax=Bradyrhizobium sp. HKCCYLS1011 TaxID=3420733 RepID=UPI003EBA3E9A
MIKPTGNAGDLAGSELIIEAVFEDRELKRSVTQEAEPYLALGGILASNTSTLPHHGPRAGLDQPDELHRAAFFLTCRSNAVSRDHQGSPDVS